MTRCNAWLFCFLFLLAPPQGAAEDLSSRALPCQRIASFAPSITQTLDVLGLGRRIYAVSDYEKDKSRFREFPKLGGYLNPNKEFLFQLDADLFILLQEQAGLAQWLEGQGKKALLVDHAQLQGLEESFAKIGDACAISDVAEEAERSWKKQFSELPALLPSSRKGESILLFVIDESMDSLAQGLYVSGKKTMHGELLEKLGLRILPDDEKASHLRLSPESLGTLQPDWIILLAYGGKRLQEQEIYNYFRRFPQMPAVRKKQIHIVTEPSWGVPGPGLLHFAQGIAKMIGH